MQETSDLTPLKPITMTDMSYTNAVYNQPGTGMETEWMLKPAADPNCPPGLEYLTQIDQLLVQQTVEILEAFVGIEGNNKFHVKNSTGQRIYYAAEESDCCPRMVCGPHRGFTMHMVDNYGEFVMKSTRDFKCCGGVCFCACLDCFSYEIEVEAPPRVPIGYVKQGWSLFKPVFNIQDEDHQTVLQLKGPCACCMCEIPCCDVEFGIYTMAGRRIGRISKQWSGLAKEVFTEADHFGVSFPVDLDVKVKATLLSAVFLINMMFFEKNYRRNR